MKQKQIKLTAHKSALSKIEQHRNAVTSGKEIKSSIVEQFAKDISKYLNKNGTLSKRALRSNKSRREFNRIVETFKKSKQYTKAQRQTTQTKTRRTLQDTHGLSNKEASKLIGIFAQSTTHELMERLGWSSEEVVEYSKQSDKLSLEDIRKVSEFVISQKTDNTPDFIQSIIFPETSAGITTTDDTTALASRVLDILDNNQLTMDELENTLNTIQEDSDFQKIESGQMTLDDYLKQYDKRTKHSGKLNKFVTDKLSIAKKAISAASKNRKKNKK